MLKSSSWDHNDAYILVKGIMTIGNTVAAPTATDNTNIKIIFKSCAPFIDSISEIKNTQTGGPKGIDVVMPMYNLTKYKYNYSKTLGRLLLFKR